MIAAQDLMVGDWVMVAECVADAHFIDLQDYNNKFKTVLDGENKEGVGQ